MKTHSSNENIGKRIAHLRKQLNLTQAQLSAEIGCTNKHLSEIERGITGISIDLQVALSQTLGCSLDYLIKGNDHSSVDHLLPASIIEILKSDNQQEIQLLLEYLRLYDKLHTTK